MEEKAFFQTKAGRLTVAFGVIIVAFVIIMIGLHKKNDVLYGIGFVMTAAAMLYSPFQVHVYERFKNKKK